MKTKTPYQTKTNPKSKPNQSILGNQNPTKVAYQEKREKENSILEFSWFFFAMAVTTKEEEEDVETPQKTKNRNIKNFN